MHSNSHRARHDDRRDSNTNSVGYNGTGPHEPPAATDRDTLRPFTLMVAGSSRAGKSSFLRLVIDTASAPSATKEQLVAVAKFVQGCESHTTHIRTAAIDVELNQDGQNSRRPLALTLIDTPSLDFTNEQDAERTMTDVLHHIDSRFGEGLEDEWKGLVGDRFVHMCIYFLDPDEIVPPSVPGLPPPVLPRGRNGSFSQPEEPVILEPPSTNNPFLQRAVLPKADIAAIRRLSGRVNVLPVIARADSLSNERLAAVKVAIRRDLAEAGIGFGIFDEDGHYQQQPDERSNGYGGQPNGKTASNGNSPSTSSLATPPALRLPYALVSPDSYSHSDGIPRSALSRHELIQHYAAQFGSPQKLARGKFVRTYRWGVLDVLNPLHSDFLSLRSAVFHHMDTLQTYTRDYLFKKFREEFGQQRPAPHHPIPQISMHPPPSNARPNLIIDTAPATAHRHAQALPSIGELTNAPSSRQVQENAAASGSSKAPSRASKQRSKKITVACNFCRSRKLKCDGGRPACGQCMKRSNPCDYMPQNKRRGTISRTQRPKGEESESDSDARSPEPSVSPQVSSQTVSRRSSNVAQLHPEGYQPLNTLPPIGDGRRERDREIFAAGGVPSGSNASGQLSLSAPPNTTRPKIMHNHDSPPGAANHSEQRREQHGYYEHPELPAIATLLPAASPSSPVPMSAPNLLAPIRPASEQQAALRKRAATVPNKNTSRLQGTSGPKVVACNFCRARKTKCDGAQPACASCARRQLACNYVHDNGAGPKKRRASTSTARPNVDSPESLSPPSSRMAPTPLGGGGPNDIMGRADVVIHRGNDEIDSLKRPLEHAGEAGRMLKKMRMDDTASSSGPR